MAFEQVRPADWSGKLREFFATITIEQWLWALRMVVLFAAIVGCLFAAGRWMRAAGSQPQFDAQPDLLSYS